MKGILVPLIIVSMTGIVVGQQQGSATRASNNDFNASSQQNSFSPRGPRQTNGADLSSPRLAPFGVLFSEDEINTIVSSNQMVISDIEPKDSLGRELPVNVVNGIALVHQKNQGNNNLPTARIFPVRQNAQPEVLAFALTDRDLQDLQTKQLAYQITDADRGKYSKVAFFYRQPPQNNPAAQPRTQPTNTSNLTDSNFSSPGQANFVGPVLPSSILDRRGETPQQQQPRNQNQLSPWQRRQQNNPLQNNALTQNPQNTNPQTNLARAPLNNNTRNNNGWSLPPRSDNGLRQTQNTSAYNRTQTQPQQQNNQGFAPVQSGPLAPIRQNFVTDQGPARANPSYLPTSLQNAAQNRIAELERKIALTEQENQLLEDQRNDAIAREASANRQLLSYKTSTLPQHPPITAGLNQGSSSYASTGPDRTADRRNQFNNSALGNVPPANSRTLTQSGMSNYSASIPGPSNSQTLEQNDNSVTTEGKKQSDGRKLLFITCMLLASLGFNIYLAVGWRGSHVRFHELADELRETFSNPV